MPSFAICAKAKEIGFDGVELLASGWNNSQWNKYMEYTRTNGMHLHVHESWSSSEANLPSLKFSILECLTFLPKSGRALDILPDLQIPKIVYAGELRPAIDDQNLWLQTCPVTKDGEMHPDFETFRRRWSELELKPSICFDFQHYLEWSTGRIMTPANFQSYSRAELVKMLIEGFDFFCPHVREIHLTDSLPRLGLKGLNVMTGTGDLPLEEVCEHIVSTGWTGYVVPEVSPNLLRLFPYRNSDLHRILDTTKKLFKIS